MAGLSDVRSEMVETIASAKLTVETRGEGFIEVTREVAGFVQQAGPQQRVLLAYLRHTSASLVIQENADPDVQTDLVTALRRLAPRTPDGSTILKVRTTCRRMLRRCSTACRCTCR